MTIAIEAERANHPQKTGVEHYAKQLILHLAKLDTKNNYILYLRTKPESWFLSLPPNFKVKVMPFPIFWTQLRISIEVLLHKPDVLFIPASALPIFHPKNSVVTIHDSAFLFYPETFTAWTRSFLHWSYKFIGKFSKKIIAVSQATKNDLIMNYGMEPEKISVVHHGYTSQALTNSPSNINLPDKYILFLSTIQPRKNLQGLVEAFKKLKTEHPELPHKLVVIGKAGWKFEPILELLEKNKDIVVYLNHVSEQQKWTTLRGASALVMPSFYEGFGMWILEAFEAGVPALVSNISSMPEVGGDAALYFNPKDSEEIKNTMLKVLTQPALAQVLTQKGKERLKDFSWEKCAKETLAVLESK